MFQAFCQTVLLTDDLVGVTTEPLIYVSELLISFNTNYSPHLFQRQFDSYDNANVIKQIQNDCHGSLLLSHV